MIARLPTTKCITETHDKELSVGMSHIYSICLQCVLNKLHIKKDWNCTNENKTPNNSSSPLFSAHGYMRSLHTLPVQGAVFTLSSQEVNVASQGRKYRKRRNGISIKPRSGEIAVFNHHRLDLSNICAKLF